MTIMGRFFRDRRGIGAIDYSFVAALIVATSEFGGRYGTVFSLALKQAFPILA